MHARLYGRLLQRSVAEDCTNALDEDCDGIVCSAIAWAKLAGDTADQGVNFVVTDASDNIYVGGTFNGTLDFGGHGLVSVGATDPEVYVAKLDPTGKVLWAKNFGTLWVWDADVDSANNLIVVGWYAGVGQFGSIGLPTANQNYVAKVSPSGDALWAKPVARKDGFEPYVTVGASDRVLVAHGTPAGTNGTSVQATISAFDAAGAPDGSQNLPAGVNDWTYPTNITADGSGAMMLALGFQGEPTFGGQKLTSAGKDDVAFIKLDDTLGPLWALHFGGAQEDRAIAAEIDANTGTIYMLGEFTGTAQFAGADMTSNSTSDSFLVAAGTGGNVTWRKQFGGLTSPWANGFVLDGAGNIGVSGLATSALDFGGGPVNGVFLAKLSSTGEHVWSKGFGTQGHGWALAADSKTNLILGGVAAGPIDFGDGMHTPKGVDAFLAKFNP